MMNSASRIQQNQILSALPRPWRAASLVVSIAAAYLLAAWLGRLIAPESPFPSPFAPAAGVALAALIACGLRYWPAVLLGDLVFRLVAGSMFGDDLWPAALGSAGVAAQAVLGAVLTRRFFTGDVSLAQPRAVLHFLLLAGPVSCMVTASVTVAAAAAWSPGLAEFAASNLWVRTWAADAVGVALIAPMALLAWPRMARTWGASRALLLVPLAVGTVVLVVTNMLVQQRLDVKEQQQRQGIAENESHRVQTALNRVSERLHAVELFFINSDEVTATEFAGFAAPLLSSSGVDSIAWAPRIPRHARAEFEAYARRATGLADYRVSTPGESAPAGSPAPADDHFPLLHIVSETEHPATPGLDYGGQYESLQAIEAALLTTDGEAVRVSTEGVGKKKLIFYHLAYRAGFDAHQADVDARRAAMRGVVIGAVDAASLMSATFGAELMQWGALRIQLLPPGGTALTLIDRIPEGYSPDWRLEIRDPAFPLQYEGASRLAPPKPVSSYPLAALLFALFVSASSLMMAGDAGNQQRARKRLAESEDSLRALNAELEARVEARTRELTTANAAALRQEREIRSLVDNLIDCVIHIDTQGIVRSVNPAAERILGFAPAEVIGRNVSMLMPEPHRAAHEHYLARYLDCGEAHIIGIRWEVQGQHKDGRLIPLELTVTEYQVEDQRFFTGILRDITQRKATDATLQRFMGELQQAREDADSANRAKSSFLATMSHEIRTPMNGVLGMLEVLEHSHLTEHQRDQVQTIRSSGATLLKLIDDILDFSKIEAGRIELEQAPLCVADLLEELCTSQLSVARQRGVALRMFIDPNLPERVLGDDTRLRQVLYNLVGNAIKFSAGNPARHGRVTVRATLASREPVRIVFTAEDNGIGMDEAAQARLFTPFTQAEASTTRRFGGTGLGLTICRRLVEVMGGEIGVQSRPGDGSVFTVTLPFDLSPEQPARAQPDLSGLVCFLLDEADLDTETLSRYLEHAGATVRRCADVGEAVRCAAAAESPTVLIHAENENRRWRDGALPAQLRRVRIGQGRRRRARLAAPDCVSLDGDALCRLAFLRAVAVAAGHALPEIIDDRSTEALPGEATPAPTVAQARAENRLILVAEDDSVNQKVILQQLALVGYAAEVTSDGAEALACWEDGGFALLLTDLHMPEMDGYQLAAAIRRWERGSERRIPIIALTANALRDEAVRAKAAGIDDYLTKPVELARLRAVLDAWLSQEKAVPKTASPRALDVVVLQRLVGDDPAILHDFLSEYARTAAQAAADLRATAAAKDHAQLAATAHKLKSSSRSVGALPLGDLCAELENAGKRSDAPAVARCMAQFEMLFAEVEEELAPLLPKEDKKK